MSNNYVYHSANMLRIGFKGSPSGTVYMIANVVNETDETEAYQGLFLVQPYGKQTESFKKLVIVVEDTIYPEDCQLCYIYAGANDTPITFANGPVAWVEGVLYDIPNQSPV